jgi:hypothetical protein
MTGSERAIPGRSLARSGTTRPKSPGPQKLGLSAGRSRRGFAAGWPTQGTAPLLLADQQDRHVRFDGDGAAPVACGREARHIAQSACQLSESGVRLPRANNFRALRPALFVDPEIHGEVRLRAVPVQVSVVGGAQECLQFRRIDEARTDHAGGEPHIACEVLLRIGGLDEPSALREGGHCDLEPCSVEGRDARSFHVEQDRVQWGRRGETDLLREADLLMGSQSDHSHRGTPIHMRRSRARHRCDRPGRPGRKPVGKGDGRVQEHGQDEAGEEGGSVLPVVMPGGAHGALAESGDLQSQRSLQDDPEDGPEADHKTPDHPLSIRVDGACMVERWKRGGSAESSWPADTRAALRLWHASVVLSVVRVHLLEGCIRARNRV